MIISPQLQAAVAALDLSDLAEKAVSDAAFTREELLRVLGRTDPFGGAILAATRPGHLSVDFWFVQ